MRSCVPCSTDSPPDAAVRWRSGDTTTSSPAPGLPAFRRQARIVVGRRTMYLDVYAERERVDIELDGATTHGDPRQGEIDLRRDALLATVGILVVRFARHRLIHEPDAVRHEVRAILATRRDAAAR
ncbi:endonuclease domain-containing protein [Micromonospora humidisoli]|uniref:endonuclease domain-containing protein n=1 Tax=Micromonospora humidisoli TaxID=2807622 RepID=UPI0027DDA134|nr:DUF559 domain-containing protein [Micromonospora humidisoli]